MHGTTSAPSVEPISSKASSPRLSSNNSLSANINAAASALPPPSPACVGMFFIKFTDIPVGKSKSF